MEVKRPGFEESVGFFKAVSTKHRKSRGMFRSFRCWLTHKRRLDGLLKAMKRMRDIKPHPLLTLVGAVLLIVYMGGGGHALVLLQLPNPLRVVALFGTIVVLVIGVVAVDPHGRLGFLS